MHLDRSARIMATRILFFLILFFGIVPVQAQETPEHRCSTDTHHHHFDLKALSHQAISRSKLGGELYIPIVIHSIGDSKGNGHKPAAELLQNICDLNEDYKDTKIRFYLKRLRRINRDNYYEHNSSTGFQMMQKNKIEGAMNVFVVKKANGACGYYQPGTDCIAVAKACFAKSSSTLAHEAGHYFSLPHTFNGWEGKTYNADDVPTYLKISGTRDTLFVERVDGANCKKSGDRICDTPPDYINDRWNCNSDGLSQEVFKDPDGNTFRVDGSLYMSYSNDRCQSRFSEMQIAQMDNQIRTRRGNMITNEEDLPPALTETDVPNALPSNSEEIDYQNVKLQWDHVDNATHYIVQLSRFTIFDQSVIEFEKIVTKNELELDELREGKNYYWRVKPYNGTSLCHDFGTVHKFKAINPTNVESFDTGNSVYIQSNVLLGSDPTLRLAFNFSDILPTTIQVYSISGRMVHNQHINNPSHNDVELRLNALPSGTYLLKMQNKKNRILKKIIVQ